MLLIWLSGVELIIDRLYVVLVIFCVMVVLMFVSIKLILIVIIRMLFERCSFLDNFLFELIIVLFVVFVVLGVIFVFIGFDVKGIVEDLLIWF